MNLFSGLPEEICLHIFSYFSLPELYTVAQVCRDFYRFSKDSSLDLQERFLSLIQREIDRQDYDRAIEVADALLNFDKKCALAYKQRGLCWDYKFETEKAVRDFQLAIETASEPSQQHLYRSYLYLCTKQYQQAYEEVNKAIAAKPDDPRNYHQRAYILFKLPTANKQETQDKELADYEKVLTMSYKRMPIIYNNIGYVYYEKENYEKALEYYSKSIAQCPYHVRAYYNRTTIWEEMHQWQKAIMDYNSILQINPKIYEVYYFRSRCYYHLGEIQKAIEDCRYSVRKNKVYSYPLAFLYSMLLSRGDVDDALNELSGLIEETNKEILIWECFPQDSKDENNTKMSLHSLAEVVERSNRSSSPDHIAKSGAANQMGGSGSSGNVSPNPVRYQITPNPNSVISHGDQQQAPVANINSQSQSHQQQNRNGIINILPTMKLSEFRFTNRERKLQKLKEFRQMLYKLRGELSFLVGDFERSSQDYNELLRLDTRADWAPLLSAMSTHIDNKKVSVATVTFAQPLLRCCQTRASAKQYVASLRKEQPTFTLPDLNDQLYFVTCFAYRFLELFQPYHNNIEILLNFWRWLTRTDEKLLGLRLCYNVPSLLTQLFEFYKKNDGHIPDILLDTFNNFFNAAFSNSNKKDTVALEVFFNFAQEYLGVQTDESTTNAINFHGNNNNVINNAVNNNNNVDEETDVVANDTATHSDVDDVDNANENTVAFNMDAMEDIDTDTGR